MASHGHQTTVPVASGNITAPVNTNVFPVQQLRPANALTRRCAIPGQLEYHEYIAYLQQLGHVVPEQCDPLRPPPQQPQNSALQNNSSDRTDDMTDFRPDQAMWNIDNLPNILYILTRPETWLAKSDLREPPVKTYQIYGQFLRDIPVLPDHISSRLEGWRYEAWVRLDPRIGYADIVARIAPQHRPRNKSRIQMRAKRFRQMFKMHGWVTKGKNFEEDLGQLTQELVDAGIDPNRNTTRGLSWGLINVVQGELGGRVPIPEPQRPESTVDQSGANLTAPPTVSTSSSTQGTNFSGLSLNPYTVTSTIVTTAGIATTTTLSTGSTTFDPLIHSSPATPSPLNRTPRSTHESESPINTVATPQTPLSRSTPLGSSSRPRSILQSHYHTRSQTSRRPQPRGIEPNSSRTNQETNQNLLEIGAIMSAEANRVTIVYAGKTLVLKTEEERNNLSFEDATLLTTFYPAGSEERNRQLEFVLDPERAIYGFVDNHGTVESIPPDHMSNCSDQDVIYSIGPLPSFSRW